MTHRAKPTVRPRRSVLDRPDRKNFLTNLAFGLVVIVALLVLVLAAFFTWYDEHLAPVASVDGEGISRDQLTRRFDVEAARLDIAQSRIHDEFNAGRLTAEQRDAQLQFLEQRRQQLPSIALERLIDARIQADLAEQQGIEITDDDVEAQIAEEATRPEQRHVWIIEVEPEIEDGAEEPTAIARQEAEGKAREALEKLRAGSDWVEVSKEYSTGSTAETGGDLGWVTDDFDADQAFVDAVFAVERGGITDVFESDDGVYRIARVTDIVEETVEADYRALMAARGVPRDVYETAVRQDLAGEKLRERIEEQALAPGEQRRVSEIYLENQSIPEALPEGSVKTRHILVAPKDDAQNAGELPDDDPAWKEAEEEARQIYEDVTKDPSTFDAVAREKSDEGSADISGGKLPWFDPSWVTSGQLDPAFGAAIFADGLEAGDILEPVQSDFGWHVIQIMYYPTDEEQARRLKEQVDGGADFAELARDYSAAPEAAEGGELGWIARYQVDLASEEAIFAAPIGEVTDPVVVDGDGVHLYLVHEEQTRELSDDQRTQLEQSAFTNWYQAKKRDYTIVRDVGGG